VLGSLAELSRIRREIASTLDRVDDISDAKKAIREWAKRRGGDALVADSLFEASVKADLAGQLMVRSFESKVAILREPGEPNAFVELSLEEAIDEFRKRNIQPDKQLNKVLKQYRKRATQASELMIDALETKVQDGIARALQEGETLRDFTQRIRQAESDLGVEPASKFYLETIYRTNVQTAYGAGRFRQMTDPDVIAVRPYVQYRTVQDGRVRPEHAVLDGQVWSSDDSTWHRIAPPNGYNCRCSIVTLDADELGDNDVREIQRGIPEGFKADDGFDGPPDRAVARDLT
jgi:SPP1 gp7 family putative phage head morphogenesis protein